MTIKLTLIARVSDGLPLAASMEDERNHREIETYKQQAKRIFKQLNPSPLSKCSIDTNSYTFHYIIENGVCYLCLVEKQYPSQLAFSYLQDLMKEFDKQYARDVSTVARPYAFIRFDSHIQKTKRAYQDSRSQRNLDKISQDLGQVQQVMRRNIQEVLGRGEKLDTVTNMSSQLSMESKRYMTSARRLNRHAMLRRYGPLIALGLIFLTVLYVRFLW